MGKQFGNISLASDAFSWGRMEGVMVHAAMCEGSPVPYNVTSDQYHDLLDVGNISKPPFIVSQNGHVTAVSTHLYAHCSLFGTQWLPTSVDLVDSDLLRRGMVITGTWQICRTWCDSKGMLKGNAEEWPVSTTLLE